MSALRKIDANGQAYVDYWTTEEVKKFYGWVKPLCPMTHTYIKFVAAQALALGKVVDHYVSGKTSREMASNILVSETIFYHSELAGGFVTPAVFQLVLCTTVPAIKKPIEWFHKISASIEITDNLMKLSCMDGSQIQSDQPTANVVAESASHLAQVIRSVCLFHNHAERMACLIDKKAMLHEFLCRIDNDGVLTEKRNDLNQEFIMDEIKQAYEYDELRALFEF